MSVRQPRAFLSCGGQIVPTELDVTRNGHASSGNLTAHFPVRGKGVDAGTLSGSAPIPVEAIIDGQRVFTGELDHVEMKIDVHGGASFHVSARDKGAKLLDAKSTEAFRNMTHMQVVQQLAGKAGLGVVTDGGEQNAGKEYKSDEHELITDHSSPWSAIQKMAELDGKTAFVDLDSLYYVDPSFTTGGGTSLIYMPPSELGHANGNFLSLHLRRNLNMSKTLNVEVKSWHSKKRKMVQGQASKGGSGGTREYKERYPHLTDGQANNIANKRAKELGQHEYTVHAEIPGDASLSVRGQVSVGGTGTAFDRSYMIDSLHHRIDSHGGFHTRISGKMPGGG